MWVRNQLDRAKESERILAPQSTVIAADMTFWGRQYGVCVFRSPTLSQNLWWDESSSETPEIYKRGYDVLREQGWEIAAAVVDGKRGVAKVFEGIPVQYCQFHQIKTVTKYLTRKPKTPAAQELRTLAITITRTDEKTFITRLSIWYERYRSFLEEYTICSYCKRKHYVHRRLRSAYRSLTTNLPFLFTYQKYPELHIPNTTNCLDGMFSQIKNRLAVHRGLRRDRRYKIIGEILKGSN